MSRNLQIAILVVLGLLFCCLVALIVGILAWPTISSQGGMFASATATPSPIPPKKVTPLPRSTPTPALAPTSTPVLSSPPDPNPGEPLTTEERLLAADVPQRDIRLLAERLLKIGPIPEVVHESAPVYEIGDVHTFWVGNTDTLEQAEIQAVLRYETPHLYMWVEKGVRYDRSALEQSAERFERESYPTVRAFFGSEWSPGVDNDLHLHVLHSTGKRMGHTVAGYYSSADEYARAANPYSNEREMFYISLSGMVPGTDFYDGVLAHEFQHMVHWANDRNEETWVNEGCSELAAYLLGYDPGGFDQSFTASPDVQLNTWPDGGSSAPHYGNSYLFVSYVLGRFGEEAVQQVVAHPENGSKGFDAVLADYGLTFDDVFTDWVVANYLDSQEGLVSVPDKYLYPRHQVGPVAIDTRYASYPVEHESTVHQYAADYYHLAGQGNLEISFTGATETRLVAADAHSGRYAWWSNRGDDSDATLTRAFDLRSLSQATLRVWMWYDIERDWDYGYVLVSKDGGQTWDALPGPMTTTTNPNGNSFGYAYTGRSQGWVEEGYDLSAYAGHEILLRFEYVTDDAVNGPGWLIDDIRIPELGYETDLESGPGEWEAAGFVYSDNRLPQRYQVQVVTVGQETQVLALPVDEVGQGSLTVSGLGQDVDAAVLIVSAMAPVTTEVAEYAFTIEQAE